MTALHYLLPSPHSANFLIIRTDLNFNLTFRFFFSRMLRDLNANNHMPRIFLIDVRRASGMVIGSLIPISVLTLSYPWNWITSRCCSVALSLCCWARGWGFDFRRQEPHFDRGKTIITLAYLYFGIRERYLKWSTLFRGPPLCCPLLSDSAVVDVKPKIQYLSWIPCCRIALKIQHRGVSISGVHNQLKKLAHVFARRWRL